MPVFDVVRAAAAMNAVTALPVSEARIERLLETCGLPSLTLHRSEGLISLRGAEAFLIEAQAAAGDPTFTFRSFEAEDALQSHQTVGLALPAVTCGLDAARKLTQTLDGALTGARFRSKLKDGLVWITRSTGTTDCTDDWAVHQYNIRGIWSGMRRMLGPEMLPVAMQLKVHPPPDDMPEELRDLPVTIRPEGVGLGYSLRDLASVEVPDQAGLRWPGSPGPLGADHLEHVVEVIGGLLGSECTDRLSMQVARAFGISLRSYQRQLAALGSSHAALLERARMRQALRRLAAPDVRVTEVAMDLGYRHPGDFSRFFKRRMGLSPAEFIRLPEREHATAPGFPGAA